ncbi:hypothetical protein PT974_03857 [Cladobotryum mycophilum]|uniref:Uncharacterized protein n=1 Tax=Cladobotryum mycophilum TaxID=491253 RepID=A0ABR0SUM1_9HYPO
MEAIQFTQSLLDNEVKRFISPLTHLKIGTLIKACNRAQIYGYQANTIAAIVRDLDGRLVEDRKFEQAAYKLQAMNIDWFFLRYGAYHPTAAAASMRQQVEEQLTVPEQRPARDPIEGEIERAFLNRSWIEIDTVLDLEERTWDAWMRECVALPLGRPPPPPIHLTDVLYDLCFILFALPFSDTRDRIKEYANMKRDEAGARMSLQQMIEEGKRELLAQRLKDDLLGLCHMPLLCGRFINVTRERIKQIACDHGLFQRNGGGFGGLAFQECRGARGPESQND